MPDPEVEPSEDAAKRPRAHAGTLWRHPDFLKLWTGQTVSRLGSVVTRTAVPHRGPFAQRARNTGQGLLRSTNSVVLPSTISMMRECP